MPMVGYATEELIGLGAYPPVKIQAPAIHQPPRVYGAARDRKTFMLPRVDWTQTQQRGGMFVFQFIPQLTAEIDFTIAALKAAAAGKPIARPRGLPETARPGERPDSNMVMHVDAILQLQRAGRSWIYTFPYTEIAAFIPGLTREQLASVKNQLWKPEWGPPAEINADIVESLDGEIQWLEGRLKVIDEMLLEVTSYEPWLKAVLHQFATYVQWFKRHLEKKEEKTRAIGVALSATALVLNFVPVVGNILALVVEGVNIYIQVDAFKKQLEALAEAGGKIFGGQVAAALMEAVTVTKIELLNARDFLSFELEYRALEREILGGPNLVVTTGLDDPGDKMDVAMQRLNVGPPRPAVGTMALALGGFAAFAALALRGRR